MINSLISIILLPRLLINKFSAHPDLTCISAVFITVSYSNTNKLQLHVPFLSLIEIETQRKDEEDQHEEGDEEDQRPLWRSCQTQREHTRSTSEHHTHTQTQHNMNNSNCQQPIKQKHHRIKNLVINASDSSCGWIDFQKEEYLGISHQTGKVLFLNLDRGVKEPVGNFPQGYNPLRTSRERCWRVV